VKTNNYPTVCQIDGSPFRKTISYKADLDVKKDERCVIAAISTDAIDRSGEVVVPRGIEKDSYRKNPVVLWAHDYRIPPIGKALWVKNSQNGRQLISKTQFNTTELGQQIFELYLNGHMNAFSIGFIAREYSPPTVKEMELRPELEACRLMIRKSSLLEYSAVPVPCNPEALAYEVSKGLAIPKELDEVVRSRVFSIPIDITDKSTELNDENVSEEDKCEDVKPIEEAEDKTEAVTEPTVEEVKVVEEVKAVETVETKTEDDAVAKIGETVKLLSDKLETALKTIEMLVNKDGGTCQCKGTGKCTRCVGTGKCGSCLGSAKCSDCMGKGCKKCSDCSGDCPSCSDGKCIKCGGKGNCPKCKADDGDEDDKSAKTVEPIAVPETKPEEIETKEAETKPEAPVVVYRKLSEVEKSVKAKIERLGLFSDADISKMAKEEADRQRGRV